jgi:hypothetical protein
MDTDITWVGRQQRMFFLKKNYICWLELNGYLLVGVEQGIFWLDLNGYLLVGVVEWIFVGWSC